MNNDSLKRRDLSALWHPCTQMKDHEWMPMIPIRRGSGVWLEDYDGNRYLDAISSWWVNLFGHANATINTAIQNQLNQLEHVILAGFTHEPAVKLAEHLVRVVPHGLTRCFFAENGSSAIEIALKMSFHYWHNRGNHQKTRFISLENSYHGDTLGALSVGNTALFKDTYKPLLMDVINVPGPDCFFVEAGESWKEYSTRKFMDMERSLQQHCHEVCAVIVEPLVQCAGNMRMYHPIYLKLLREACDRYGVHLIADEVAVGFGRTGTLFACEQGEITPDFLCLAKGLTGGYLPLSTVLTSEDIYTAFYDDYINLTAFLHSHSYTGNALCCAAALATLLIFENDNIIEKNQELSAAMTAATEHFNQHPNVGEVRQTGMILAIELVKDKATRSPFPWQERRGMKVYLHGLSKGVLLRPIGNVIYFMPPYVITREEIQLVANVAWEAIQLATLE